MDSRISENIEEIPSVETPEDVAVLYSWANLHGAKYRDFSASRREYRAQLRHRAAEQVREVELRAQADAEATATIAGQNAQRAGQQAEAREQSEAQRLQALRDAEEAEQIAAAERMEAARRVEAAAQAEATAHREERELALASASARRQATLYAESDSRGRVQQMTSLEDEDLPGKISDPYTPEIRPAATEAHVDEIPEPAVELHPNRYRSERTRMSGQIETGPRVAAHEPGRPIETQRAPAPQLLPVQAPSPARRPQGYRPDDASGVRQIYRPELDSSPEVRTSPRDVAPVPRQSSRPVPPYATRETTLPRLQARADEAAAEPSARIWTPAPTTPPATAGAPPRQMLWANSAPAPAPRISDVTDQARRPAAPTPAFSPERRVNAQPPREDAAGQFGDPTPKRRRQDIAGYRPTDSDRAIAAYRREQAQPIAYANAPSARPAPEAKQPRKDDATPANTQPAAAQRGADPVGPAWIYAQDSSEMPAYAAASASPEENLDQQQPVVDTLQRSRERVASRWYALKGVFEQAGQERQEAAPVRQKETRTPVLAVFSLAGGVGKTSLVATLGRSLSSLGEKVLLTDTTSHGLLPYYFGASELRQGTVRTFSPPSGSTDAPIYLVNYGVDQDPGDEAAQEALVEEISGSGRGTHRIVLDLTSSTSWVIRRMARLNPTVLVPVAPDMNSVISLQAIEKFFHGVNGADGTPLKFFYVLNQFDAALPLHLDVREVLRRQLGDRLLPFVIRRAPAVSEALAEGMTIIDYSPEAPVAEDYMNLATWLRAQSAPATAGFRNVRWSER